MPENTLAGDANREMREDGLPQLISAQGAFEMFEHLYDGTLAIKEMLADELRDGRIGAYAEHAWETRERSLERIFKSKPPADADYKVKLIPRELKYSIGWTLNAREWDWPAGRFFADLSKAPIKRKIFSRVQLVREDIDALRRDTEQALEKKMSNRGRKTKQDAWDEVWLAVIKIATAGPFTREALGQQQQFEDRVIRELGGQKMPH